MSIAIITGSAGLIGSESVRFLSDKFDYIIGIDNDLRSYFFGKNASVNWNKKSLIEEINNYTHLETDVRDFNALNEIFKKYNLDIKLIIHAAAQPSHDWAVKEPLTDFAVNAAGTINLLEATRLNCPDAVFIFTSTNKVYGDRPNNLPLIELETRWEISNQHAYYDNGINEEMSIDQSKHSLFGASKLAADILCQEYGKYFQMKVGIFRGGCLTGPNHSGTQLHGFLSYLMKCAITGDDYTIFGYKGKQVRDNIHSYDLVNMFWHFYLNPKCGEVYNVGGGRYSNCSMKEAITMCERLSGNKMNINYSPINREGDHIWWISDVSKFRAHYSNWNWQFDLENILQQIHESIAIRI